MTGRDGVRLLRSRRILARDGWLDGTIEIRDGRIVALRPRTAAAGAARGELDVGDAVVLPGLVDTHAHMRDPGFTHKEDWAHGSRAAAAGGVTTVIDMPNVEPPPATVERFEAHRANAADQSVVDFGHHAAGTMPEEIPGLAAAGAVGFKVFMKRDVARSYPHMPGTAVDDHARLYEICEAVAATGRPLLVHPDDQALAELFAARAWEREGRDFRAYARALRAGDGVTADVGIATMLALQRATGVRLHLLHVSTPGGWELIRMAKAAGRPVTAEVNPFHLSVVNDWSTIERWGPYALGSWIPATHAEATWSAVLDGTADVIGSDHTPHAREEKETGWDDMFVTPGGSPTIQHYLSLLLTEVARGRVSLERVVELCCTAPAALLGLAGVKGTIAVGADADVVVVDLERTVTIREADVLSKCGWTILDGREVTGVPLLTMVRGEVVVRDGRVLADEGSGRSVGRRVP
jgi:dihydroorotase (multifunctional complex type)